MGSGKNVGQWHSTLDALDAFFTRGMHPPTNQEMSIETHGFPKKNDLEIADLHRFA